ncbi:uncharacterized protein LOC106657038 [Trichogramma pretiosum]|uniref:Late endosomal/lysosomal adaptor and MAPK and MTOR activator 5 n=1 Tax=Trichogramma kaykai TaxID=54128 RepID=A0ABD2WJV0_9HYME|nr:uncharacterized protein LOC106657038 [Trichogramma pretiosum]
MEKGFERQIKELNRSKDVIGCLLTDKSGLCLAASGIASRTSSGVIAAIAEMSRKIEPNSKPPVISLQNDTRQILIHQKDNVIGAVFKEVSS